MAMTHVALCGSAFATGVWLARSPSGWPTYIVSQLLLALAFTQAFVLLHEAGHRSLFRQAWLNVITGQLAGFLALIPYAAWRPIHARHHRYTGWQDLDATTATLLPRPLARWERTAVNLAWRTYLPLFSILYRLQNYWHLPRVMRYLGAACRPLPMILNMIALLTLYGCALVWIGAPQLAYMIGPGLMLALMSQDILLLSQHTHMPAHISSGAAVRPFTPMQQGEFTRSLRLPRVLSWLWLHVDAHELHHLYPALPGYLLRRIPFRPDNEVHWWVWLRAVKRLSGTEFLFGKREQTGFDL